MKQYNSDYLDRRKHHRDIIHIYTVDVWCYSLSKRLARLLASIIRSTLDPPYKKIDQQNRHEAISQ